MRKLFIAVLAILSAAGCASPVSYGPPEVHHQFAKDSQVRMDKAMDEYYACLAAATNKYRATAAPSDVADAAQATCDHHAKDYERHVMAYSMALRIGHPNEMAYGQATASKLYTEMVQKGRGFVLDRLLRQ